LKVLYFTPIHSALNIVFCTGRPSRTSFIFYAGLEGMGGLDLETDENENVRNSSFYLLRRLNEHVRVSKVLSFSLVQHLSLMNLPFELWTVRLHLSPQPNASRTQFPGPDNKAYSDGPHSDVFASRIGRTHYGGFRVPAGNIWQAKGRRIHVLL
jgi:mannosyl-oligosaccharide glucosidase